MKDEQSHASGPLAPYTYGSPACCPAQASTAATRSAGSGVVVRVALSASAAGRVAQDEPAAVGVGVVQDVVDVPGGVVVREQRPPDPGLALGDPGPGEVVRRGEHAVGVAGDDGPSVAVAVDAVRGERGGHELHQPSRPSGGGGGRAPVGGLFHPDPGEQRPRQLVPLPRRDVEGLDGGRDGGGRGVQGVQARGPGRGAGRTRSRPPLPPAPDGWGRGRRRVRPGGRRARP